MVNKLTLALDAEVIDRAKAFAKKQNTSLSKLVENYLSKVAGEDAGTSVHEQPSPLVRRLTGILEVPADFDEKKAYVDHLSKKYGL